MLPPILISLRPPRQLVALLVIVHLGAGVAALTLTVPAWQKGGLVFVILASGVFYLWRKWCIPFTALHLDVRGGCSVATKIGAGETAIILSGITLLSVLIVLKLGVADQRHTLVLMPDSAPADDLRRLRVWLRTRAGQVSASA